ncbi:MAG TPA: sigma-70 family RNA polymerase sigma factor [Gemmataceae bacterium]|nr:sigma-70 family RNA polymerase sigma factor [Gemmataceae bacterium]
MSDDSTFADFIRRVRAGDEQAAADLVRRYEPLIRREVRLQLEDRRLGRLFDSMDVCQSVLASFFVRTAAGEYDLNLPGQLVGLLVRMARNKLASAARRQHRLRRDVRRIAADGAEALDRAASGEPTPSEVVAGRELLARFRESLTEDERRIADLRAHGASWDDVAVRFGGTAKARRMQLSRAVDRVARQLGLDEEDGA